MSDLSRGSKYEDRIRRFLESNGYITEKAPNVVVWIRKPGQQPFPISKKRDFFGCIDVIGIHHSRDPVLAQVCTAKNRAARRRKVEEGLQKILSPVLHSDNNDILLFTWGKWKGRGYGFIVERMDRTGSIGGKPTWDEYWSPLVESGFLPSKEAR